MIVSNRLSGFNTVWINYVEINNKREFYKLWREGVLGNRTNLYDSFEEAAKAQAHKPWDKQRYGFREIGRSGGGKWELGTNFYDAKLTADRWIKEGRKFIIDDSVPNHKSLMQGEVCRTEKGLQSFLAIGYGLKPMRLTMAAGLHKHRGYLETRLLLEKFMDASSRDDLDQLLELYPDSAIELTCFDIKVGHFPNRNTIFWETRNY